MQIFIEAVDSSQEETLLEISRKTFFDTFSEQNTKEDMDFFLDKNFNQQSVHQELTDPQNYLFFAKINNVIAGYLKLTDGKKPPALKEADSLEIARIYITKDN